MVACMNCGAIFDPAADGYDQPNLMTRQGRISVCQPCVDTPAVGGSWRTIARLQTLQTAVRDNEGEREYIQRDERAEVVACAALAPQRVTLPVAAPASSTVEVGGNGYAYQYTEFRGAGGEYVCLASIINAAIRDVEGVGSGVVAARRDCDVKLAAAIAEYEARPETPTAGEQADEVIARHQQAGATAAGLWRQVQEAATNNLLPDCCLTDLPMQVAALDANGAGVLLNLMFEAWGIGLSDVQCAWQRLAINAIVAQRAAAD